MIYLDYPHLTHHIEPETITMAAKKKDSTTTLTVEDWNAQRDSIIEELQNVQPGDRWAPFAERLLTAFIGPCPIEPAVRPGDVVASDDYLIATTQVTKKDERSIVVKLRVGDELPGGWLDEARAWVNEGVK